MNVLFLEQQPRFGGGSERISFSLCTYLHGEGHTTHLLHEADGDMVQAYSKITSSVTRAPVRPLAVRQPRAAAASLFGLWRTVRKHRVDVVFTSQIGYVSLLALARRLLGVRCVVHLGLALDLGSPVFRWALQHISATVTPSEPMRIQCLGIGWPPERLRVVPNGVDLARFRPSEGPSDPPGGLVRREGTPQLVYAGRLVAEKGIFTLLRAAALLMGRGVNFHLAMAGLATGDERKQLIDLASELGLGSERFSLLPATDRPEDLFRAADIAVVPSEWQEPFGLVAIEAMACGAVPVVSDAGILPEIVGEAAAPCVFPKGHADRLADAIESLIDHPVTRAAIRESCLDRVRKHYSLQRFGEAYAAILESAAVKP